MNRTAIVTGGSTGIGRATAIELARVGHDVALTYAHSQDEAEVTASAIRDCGAEAYVQKLDLSDPASAPAAVDSMVDKLGRLDVLVSNAGMMNREPLSQVELGSVRGIFDVNVFGALMAIKQAAWHMLRGSTAPPAEQSPGTSDTIESVLGLQSKAKRSEPGRIIVVTSVHEHVANPTDLAYTMTKHALGGMIKCLALELTPRNITVNAVAPGEIATPMNNMQAEDAAKQHRPAVPCRRAGKPSEVAAAVRFLASDEAGFITGISMPVDGGFEIMTPYAHSYYREKLLASADR